MFFNFIFVQNGTHNSLFFTILYVILYIALLKRDYFYKIFGDIFPLTYSHFGKNLKQTSPVLQKAFFQRNGLLHMRRPSGPHSLQCKKYDPAGGRIACHCAAPIHTRSSRLSFRY